MKISSKCRYAVAAMLELASRYNEYVSVADLASRRKIPRTFLEQLLLRMKREGLTVSRRGPEGGYSLAQPPDRIRLADIYVAVEGPLNLSSGRDGRDAEGEPPDDSAERFWRALEATILEYLNGITLEDLLSDEQDAPQPIPVAHPYTFSI